MNVPCFHLSFYISFYNQGLFLLVFLLMTGEIFFPLFYVENKVLYDKLPEGMQDIEITPSFLLKGTNSPHGHPLAVFERSNTTRVHSLKLFRKQCRTSQRLHFFSIRVTDQARKNICVFTVTCQNYRQNRKLSCPVPESDSGISFSKFSVSRHLFYDELHSFSTFFALNFDKKLAVE